MSLPYGYLIGLIVLVLPVLRLPRLPILPGTAVFLVTIAVIELPFIAVAAFAASTGLAFAEGDLDSPVAIGAAALAAACLALTAWRGMRTGRVLQVAMGDTPVPTRLPYWRILLCPFAFRPGSVERVADLSYGPAGERNLLDLYRHRSRPTGAPVLIHFHGGYYAMGRKNSQSLPMLHRLAAQGWVCVSANYRLRPDAGFEDHVVDAKRVVAWVRAHGRAWGADPDRIVLTGSSAGAHMSALAALTADDPAFQPGFEEVDTSVSAVVGLGGYFGPYFDRDEQTSPLARVRPDAPPFLIVHGDHDTAASAADARRFAEGLRAVSEQKVVYAELPGGQHGFDKFHSPRFEAVVNAVEAFAEEAFATGGVAGRTIRSSATPAPRGR
ncbi:alpha/beta hydrolase [Glycomyces sp. NRRL B-16210]|uniref:alpha/beta hydrolase n=1 Tax=Glycomyces sp. NRRL B-16210 TaxID=1463821 RepID=UPI0009DE59FA|nr:alpha/beta hydrolase [Glycomyces sp. NRRL B-16210]